MSPSALLAGLPSRWGPEDARRVLEALEQSRLSVADFCVQQRLDPQRVYGWRRRLRSSSASPWPKLIEVRARVPDAACIEIGCPSGHVIRIRCRDDVALIGPVLRAIEDASC